MKADQWQLRIARCHRRVSSVCALFVARARPPLARRSVTGFRLRAVRTRSRRREERKRRHGQVDLAQPVPGAPQPNAPSEASL